MSKSLSPFLASVCVLVLSTTSVIETEAFTPLCTITSKVTRDVIAPTRLLASEDKDLCQGGNLMEKGGKILGNVAAAVLFSASALSSPVYAENELSAKYGGGFDSSLVDQNCLLDKCSLQAKACLADDPSCRKGLTCTAKCLGDNTCITGCMAQYGNKNLDNLLKCTIEDNECIKIAILDGGADKFGAEPRSPAPTLQNFNLNSLDGTWFKVVGYNPNYDCYACQRNSFTVPKSPMLSTNDKLQMDVEFSMPRMLPDGSPPPPKNVRETIEMDTDTGMLFGSKSIGLNDYSTHETMVFDNVQSPLTKLVMNTGTSNEISYARTAHSEGEMFGLKFWENWYVLGENEPGTEEFKFIFYNGKTRQNTYEGAFVYSRSKQLSPESLSKVYNIAQEAGMNPDQFCKIRNGCFEEENKENIGTSSDPFRGFLASTKVSELLGVEPVAARDVVRKPLRTADVLTPAAKTVERPWWQEVGDYLENPHKHFQVMDDLRLPVSWPEDVKSQQ